MIRSKLEMYSLYEKGEFGNRFECWPSLQAMLNSDCPDGQINMRHRTNGLSGFLYMNLSRSDVLEIMGREVIPEREIPFTKGDQKDARFRTFQGEVVEDENGWSLHYSMLKEPMRSDLLKAGLYAQGLRARLLVRHFFDQSSYENLTHIFNQYPKHVVEFTCFSRSVGVLGWNTVFWEVRYY